MTDIPTEEELAQWLRLEPRSRELVDELRPVLARFLFKGHTRRLIIHDLLFFAYALAAGPLNPDPDDAPEPITPEQAADYIRDFLNALIEYHRDFPTHSLHAADPDTTH